jgi:hypothetical protein
MLSYVKRMERGLVNMYWKLWRRSDVCMLGHVLIDSANNLNRMRLGPGKHLHGQELFGGVVKGEEFDYFQ